MMAARCLMLNSYLKDRYFSVHLTTDIEDVKLSTNLVNGWNDLWKFTTTPPHSLSYSRSVIRYVTMSI